MSRTTNGTQLLPPEDQGLQSTELQSTELQSTEVSAAERWPMPPAEKGLGDHPLWQEYLAELEANRQADIAEANRLADLEMGL
jgi:hypothetical protein